ncbi:MAG TPA: hypothetical protein VGX76_09130 [Pirellulales bacterium]|nr:hypothetical protein [Pirellulales bacterium]
MSPSPRWNQRLRLQVTARSSTPPAGPNRCPACRHEAILEPYRLPGDSACPNCGHRLWIDLDGTVRDVAGVAVRRRMLKIAFVLLMVALVFMLVLFGVPSMNPFELAVIATLAAILFGPKLFKLARRALRFRPLRRGPK